MADFHPFAEGHQPQARPPAEVVELINGAKDPHLGKSIAVSTWVLLAMEGATRGRSEDARKRGSETRRPHRLPAGWSRPAMLGPRPLAPPPGLTTTVTTSRKEIPSVHRGGTRGPLKGPQCRQQASGSARGSTELVPAHATPHPTPHREGALCPSANTGMLNDLGIQWPAPKHTGKARVLTPRESRVLTRRALGVTYTQPRF